MSKMCSVQLLGDYKIAVELDNGSSFIYDLKPKLQTTRFAALADSRQSGANEGRQARQDTTGHKPLNESPPRRVWNGERER